MSYDIETKGARMLATRGRIDSGGAASRLEICTVNYGVILAVITLGFSGNNTAVLTDGDTLLFSGFPRNDPSIRADGIAAIARIRNSLGQDIVPGITVGVGPTFEVNVSSTDFRVGKMLILHELEIRHAV